MSATMRLPTLIIFFSQVLDVKTGVLAKPPEQVSGYVGENITLPSGADPSWNLIKIEWSIYVNNTWIATYRKGKTNTDRVLQYKGRLTLNTTSGDLTIHNLTADDAREYNVDLYHTEDTANKIILTVKKKLQQPSVHIISSTSTENGCVIVMSCSSRDNGVDLSWTVEPRDVLTMTRSNPSNRALQLFAFVNTTQKVDRFTCNSSRNTETVSSESVTPQCNVLDCTTQPPPTTEKQGRGNYGLSFLGGIIVGALLPVIVYFFREQIKSAYQHLKGIICVS